MRKIAPLLIAMMVIVTVPLAYAQDAPTPFELRHQLGRGIPDRIQWQPGGDRLLVSSVTGAWLYTDTLEDITHIANVRLASFSPDGTNLAAIDGENGVEGWDSLTLEPVFTFSNFHYPERIIALEWSPSGDRLASMYEDGTVIICPINSTLTCRDLWLPDGTSLAWSTDGTYLAVATDAGRIQVWDVESGDPVFSLLEISRAYIHIHILWRNDRHLLRWQRDDSALGELWDVVTGELVTRSGAHWDGIAPAYSPDGTWLAWGDTVQNSTTGETVFEVPGYWSVWTNDGTQLATGTYSIDLDSAVDITITDGITGGVRRTMTVSTDAATRLTWHDDGDRLAGFAGGIHVWRASTGELLGVSHMHDPFRGPLSMRSDGRMVATTDERIVRVWDTESGALIAELGGHRQRLGFALWQPDGGLIATGSQSSMITESLDNTIRVWDAQAFSDTPAFTYTHQGRVQGMAWSRDGTRLASVDADGIVKVWDAASRRVTLEFDIHDAIWVADPYPLNIEWSYANDLLRISFFTTWHGDGGVMLWDAQTGEGVDGGGGNTGVVYGWTRDNSLLAARIGFYTHGGPRRLLTDIEVSTAYSPTGEEALLQLPVNNQQFNMGMFDPTGKALAVLDVNGTLWVWDLPSGHRRFRVTDIGHFQWSPDGSRLTIVREDEPARIIAADDGALRDTLTVCYGYNVAWSENTDRIACEYEGVLYLWESSR